MTTSNVFMSRKAAVHPHSNRPTVEIDPAKMEALAKGTPVHGIPLVSLLQRQDLVTVEMAPMDLPRMRVDTVQVEPMMIENTISVAPTIDRAAIARPRVATVEVDPSMFLSATGNVLVPSEFDDDEQTPIVIVDGPARHAIPRGRLETMEVDPSMLVTPSDEIRDAIASSITPAPTGEIVPFTIVPPRSSRPSGQVLGPPMAMALVGDIASMRDMLRTDQIQPVRAPNATRERMMFAAGAAAGAIVATLACLLAL